MCMTGLKQSSKKPQRTFQRTLFLFLLCAATIIICFCFKNNKTVLAKMIYPHIKRTNKNSRIPQHNDSLSTGKHSTFKNGMNNKVKIIQHQYNIANNITTTGSNDSTNTDKPSNTEPLLMVCDVPVQSGPVIKVGEHKTYVIGSYVEHRLEVRKIKTVAIVLRSEKLDYYCLFCCDGKNISIPAVYDIHSDHFNFEYGTADIVCEMPTTCKTQLHVAITAKSQERSESVDNIQSFQLIRNQQPRKIFPYNFTVCISVMFDWNNVLELIQTMEMFKILDVQKVAVYKTNCSSTTQKILDYYVKKDFVEIIPWAVPDHIRVSRGWQKWASPGELHYFGQIAALNDCVYRYMYQSEYVALQDLDELIIPMNGITWTELLPQLQKIYSTYAGFEFENNVFPLSIKQWKLNFHPDLWNKVPGVNILQHVKRIGNDPSKFNNFKVIVNPQLVFKVTVHGLLKSLGGTARVDHNMARMYHMKNVSSSDFSEGLLIEDTHLWDFADRLIPAVSELVQHMLNIH
ncbi:uncharacterized protein LOC118241246 [Electrophorus electricus]|uniref:uncharacterized protein LOC118241246 n=1 Tax=Electrophorus electricus TaxID=8005 RepID=UPI0015D09B96|nr:uncharacterized protein LOC118241246 [Electrophorus electricus]